MKESVCKAGFEVIISVLPPPPPHFSPLLKKKERKTPLNQSSCRGLGCSICILCCVLIWSLLHFCSGLDMMQKKKWGIPKRNDMDLWLEIVRMPTITHLNKAAGDHGERFIDHMVIQLLEVLNLANQVGNKKICVQFNSARIWIAVWLIECWPS